MLLGGEQNNTAAQMQAIIDFETRLANITIPSERRRDEETLYNLMTIKQLQAIADFVSWGGGSGWSYSWVIGVGVVSD